MAVTEPGVSIDERLAMTLRTGIWLDLIPDTPTGGVLDEDEMRGRGNDHDVDAALVHDLLLRRVLEDADADPRGPSTAWRPDSWPADLDLVDTTVALEPIDCMLDRGVTAKQALSRSCACGGAGLLTQTCQPSSVVTSGLTGISFSTRPGSPRRAS